MVRGWPNARCGPVSRFVGTIPDSLPRNRIRLGKGHNAAMTTAVRCGTLVDGTGADPVRGAVLVFEGDTITAVDRAGQVPMGAEVIDAGHLTVMPGMIDCHVHLASSTWGVQERLLTPYSLLIAHALNHARITLDAGFLSVRDAAGTPRGVKLAMDQGMFPGRCIRVAV